MERSGYYYIIVDESKYLQLIENNLDLVDKAFNSRGGLQVCFRWGVLHVERIPVGFTGQVSVTQVDQNLAKISFTIFDSVIGG